MTSYRCHSASCACSGVLPSAGHSFPNLHQQTILDHKLFWNMGVPTILPQKHGYSVGCPANAFYTHVLCILIQTELQIWWSLFDKSEAIISPFSAYQYTAWLYIRKASARWLLWGPRHMLGREENAREVARVCVIQSRSEKKRCHSSPFMEPYVLHSNLSYRNMPK